MPETPPIDDPVGWDAMHALFRERLAPLAETLPDGMVLAEGARVPTQTPSLRLAAAPAEGALPAGGCYPGVVRVGLRADDTPTLDRLAGAVLSRLVGWRPTSDLWRVRGLRLADVADADAGLRPDGAGAVRERVLLFRFLATREPIAVP